MHKILVLVILAAMILSACQAAPVETAATAEPEAPAAVEPQEDVELVIWHTWSDFHVTEFQKILDDFNNSHDYITVIQQAQPYTDYEGKLMQAVRQGTGPDLINTFPTVASNYIDEGLIVNLTDYVNDPEIGIPGFKDSLSENVYREVTQWNGDIYMIPMLATGEVFFYNKTLFDELGLNVPTTWEELEETGRIITAETGKPAFGFDSEIDGFQVLISQLGSGYINPETKTVEYNNEIAVERLDWFCGLVQDGVFRLVGEDQYFSNPFGSQAVASYIGSMAGYGFVESAVDGQFEFGVTTVPQGGTQEYISSWGSRWVIFTSDDAKQKAAFEFIKYMISPEVLASWSVSFGGVPSYQAAIDEPVFQEYLASNPAIKAQTEQMHRIGYLSAMKGSAAIRTVIGRAVSSACTGLKTPAEALQMAEEEGNNELSAANQ